MHRRLGRLLVWWRGERRRRLGGSRLGLRDRGAKLRPLRLKPARRFFPALRGQRLFVARAGGVGGREGNRLAAREMAEIGRRRLLRRGQRGHLPQVGLEPRRGRRGLERLDDGHGLVRAAGDRQHEGAGTKCGTVAALEQRKERRFRPDDVAVDRLAERHPAGDDRVLAARQGGPVGLLRAGGIADQIVGEAPVAPVFAELRARCLGAFEQGQRLVGVLGAHRDHGKAEEYARIAASERLGAAEIVLRGLVVIEVERGEAGHAQGVEVARVLRQPAGRGAQAFLRLFGGSRVGIVRHLRMGRRRHDAKSERKRAERQDQAGMSHRSAFMQYESRLAKA